MNHRNFALLVALACYQVMLVEAKETKWTSKLLTRPHSVKGGAFEAKAVAQDGRGNLLAAVEETGEPESSVILFKVDPFGEVIWTRMAIGVKGTPFDILVDNKTESAFIIVSESKRTAKLARAHVIRFTNIFSSNNGKQSRIGQELFFSTPEIAGTTKFFGCVQHPETGDLYITGGTSASLYRKVSLGKGDGIVVRLGSSGQVLASAQFGSKDDEVGRSIAINSYGSALAVVTKRQSASGLSTSEIYLLDPQDLSIIDGPHAAYNGGNDPLFNPKSVAIAGPIASQPKTLVTFVGGDALVRPDSQTDIYIHIFAKVANRIKEVTITFDGAKMLKGIDSCVATHIGSDGNAYCLGYTEIRANVVSRRLNLIVVSPTGQLLLSHERAIGETIPLEETPTASTIVESENSRKIVYVGRAKVNATTEPTIGFIVVPRENIPPFAGFHDVVTGAGASPVPPATVPNSKSPSLPVIAGGAVGGVVLVVLVIAGFVIVDRRKKLDAGMSRRTGVTSTSAGDYSREIEESFNDDLTPREGKASRGALV